MPVKTISIKFLFVKASDFAASRIKSVGRTKSIEELETVSSFIQYVNENRNK